MSAGDVGSELDGIRGIVLDVDDTIVDTRRAMIEAGAEAMAALWPERAGAHAAMAQRYYADPARWFARYACGEVEFTAMRRARLEEVAAAFAMVLPPDGHGAFENAYAPAFRAAQRLFPDVDALLDAADDLGIPLVLLTNSSAEVTAVNLEVLAITHRFGAVVTTDTLGVGKPDPRTYLEACRLAGTRPSDTVCIGDNLEWDVLGARSAGLRAVWIDRDGGAAERAVPAVPTVRSLDELTTVLRQGDLGRGPGMGSISSRFTS
jgi:putative hydrolase of the HAD superfamily